MTFRVNAPSSRGVTIGALRTRRRRFHFSRELRMTSRLLASTLTLLVWAHAAAATAQIAAEGSIRGFIKDEQGAVLPGVSLTASTPQSPTQFSAVSDSQGFYRLVELPPGTYDAIPPLQGF